MLSNLKFKSLPEPWPGANADRHSSPNSALGGKIDPDTLPQTHDHCTRMSTEAHTVHIGTLMSGATVGQLAVRTAHPMLTQANFGSNTPFRSPSMA